MKRPIETYLDLWSEVESLLRDFRKEIKVISETPEVIYKPVAIAPLYEKYADLILDVLDKVILDDVILNSVKESNKFRGYNIDKANKLNCFSVGINPYKEGLA